MKLPTRTLMMPNPVQRIPVGKDGLINWLDHVPEDAEISIDVRQFGQRDLIAFLEGGETDMWILALDAFTLPADKTLLDQRRELMMKRLREIHGEGGETQHGAMIVTLEGVVSGNPDLFSASVENAFTFKDRERAKVFADEFFDVLQHAVVLAC